MKWWSYQSWQKWVIKFIHISIVFVYWQSTFSFRYMILKDDTVIIKDSDGHIVFIYHDLSWVRRGFYDRNIQFKRWCMAITISLIDTWRLSSLSFCETDWFVTFYLICPQSALPDSSLLVLRVDRDTSQNRMPNCELRVSNFLHFVHLSKILSIEDCDLQLTFFIFIGRWTNFQAGQDTSGRAERRHHDKVERPAGLREGESVPDVPRLRSEYSGNHGEKSIFM
jgi:hypothetical protein